MNPPSKVRRAAGKRKGVERLTANTQPDPTTAEPTLMPAFLGHFGAA